MPVNARGCGEAVRDVDPNLIAFDSLNRWSVHAATVTPAFRNESGRELVGNRLGDEMINLYAVNHFPRKSVAVERDD